VLGESLIGAYLHGSAVLGGMKPTSDLDILVVVDRPTTHEQSRRLISGVMPISGSPIAGTRFRPVELTVVLGSDVKPWQYPPRMQLQYGEWLKSDYERGFVPDPEPNPDLAPLIAVVLIGNRPVIGSPPAELLDPVPPADLRRAIVEGVPQLMTDLESDTRNVLLTLARIWHTLATGEITSKDKAASWVAKRLPSPYPDVLLELSELYRAGTYGEWDRHAPLVRATADAMLAEISAFDSPA